MRACPMISARTRIGGGGQFDEDHFVFNKQALSAFHEGGNDADKEAEEAAKKKRP